MSKRETHSDVENKVLEYWDEHGCFERSIAQRSDAELFTFYDGPPFATGLPHYGHIVAGVMKDVVPRFWTMKGYKVDRKWGWDCHGLPIENIVEKKFELNSKKEIEEMGVAKFNDSCHSEVMVYAKEWKKVVRRLGRWVDMENDYKTMDLNFMESVWWVFKQMWDKGVIYEGNKSLHVCPRCETVLSKFEVNEGYKDVKDLSVIAEFKLTSGEYEGVNVLAWTTTPWTLPGNVLLAIGEDIDYVLVKTEEGRFIMAKELVENVFADSQYTVEGPVKTEDLLGSTYEPLFPYFADHKNAFRVVSADFVTVEDGTGVVHIAPGFGDDDKALGEKEGVAPIMHVEMNGIFVDEVAKPLSEAGYKVEGVPVKTKDDNTKVDIEIIKALAHAGKLFSKQKIEHSYPHCWRCDTPLINYSTTSWFVSVSSIVDRLTKNAAGVSWMPEHIKEGRFGKGLASSPDWSVSRSRYWGTPLPLWRAEDGDILCVGSIEELETLSGEKIDNLHKQYVDGLTLNKDGKEYKRVPEVLDCWFESGSMPYAQHHYPFENKELFEKGFPAKFIAEGADQTSLWFHKLHVIATILFDKPAYENVIVNGIVLAEDGKKMSKRLRNYPDPMEVMERFGSDAIRYYLMSSPVVHAENLRFNEKGVEDVSKQFINILSNVVSFYNLYKDSGDGRSPSGEHVLDRWILARLNTVLTEQTEAMEGYDLQTAARVLQPFVTDLSTWYIRRSRDRFKQEGADQTEALATLRHVLDTFAQMIAPFMPMLAESIYQSVDGGYGAQEGRVSVHLTDWPVADAVDEGVIEKMGEARALVSRALDAREEAGRAIKQPLASMKVSVPSGSMGEGYSEVIAQEVNVKEVVVAEGDLKVELDTELTPALIREGLVREVVRKVNQLRKEAGLTIEDKIDLFVYSDNAEVKKMFDEHNTAIGDGTLSSSVAFEKPDTKQSSSFRASEFDIEIGF
ncbi:isoleucine--tRNA ligase [Candidatus Uhrbacteria bacterium]|nr:isoleucine--tRNA ligase [Candidatus Uhrbacteria bacterium]